MDYFEIVLKGYFDQNSSQYLENYFLRECKIAQKIHFETEEFFSGCLKVILDFEKRFKEQVHERKRELYMMLSLARTEKRQESIAYCEQELKELCAGSVPFNIKLTWQGLVRDMEYQELERVKAAILNAQKALPSQQAEAKTIEMKPALKPEAVQIVFDILKDFFSPEEQAELKQIIETGKKASKKLLFKGNGNRLTDTFRKLIEHDFITGCQKQDLINWIISNFTFTQQNKVKEFVYDTVEKTISRNYSPCKTPLIEIKNRQIQRIEQPRTKKYR